MFTNSELPPPIRIPVLDIKINQRSISTGTEVEIIAITVDDDVNLPSMFTIELAGLDDKNAEIEGIDDALFKIGSEIEIRLGYSGKLVTLIKGEITGLEPEFNIDRPHSLIVRGYDYRHRLQRGRKTRTFVKQKDSSIVAQIANEAMLNAQTTDSEVTNEYVIQANQTNLEFILERARRIHYELILNDKILIFRPVGNDARESLILNFKNHLLKFHPRLSTIGQVSEVKVQGWDSKTKKAIATSHKSAVSMMAGKSTGADISRRAFEDAVEVVSDRPVQSEAEAAQMAAGNFNEIVLNFITGEGICYGLTELRAGKVIRINEIGKRFSGLYYVISASHRYDQDGYYTHFTVQRNAI